MPKFTAKMYILTQIFCQIYEQQLPTIEKDL